MDNLRAVPTLELRARARELRAELRAKLTGSAWAKLTDQEQDAVIVTAECLNDELVEIGAELDQREQDRDLGGGPEQRPIVIEPLAYRTAGMLPAFESPGPYMIGGAAATTGRQPMLQFQAHQPQPLYYGQGARTWSPEDEPGIGAARFLKIVANARGNLALCADLGARMYPGDNRLDFEAVMQQNVGTAGGILVPEQLSREIIGYLRNISVIRGHVRSLQFKGSMVIPSVEQGTTASYLSEIADDNAQDLTLGQHRLTERKLRALVAVSNDLLRNSDPGADAAVRDDLANALAEGENLAFIRGQGLNNSPKGLRYWALAANVNDGHRQHRGHHRGGHRQHGREVHLRDAGQAKRAALDHAEQKLLSAIQSAP